MERPDTHLNSLKRYSVGNLVRSLKHVALWRFISLCEYIICQWGPPGKDWWEIMGGNGSVEGGQHFTNSHEFRYLIRYLTPQDT